MSHYIISQDKKTAKGPVTMEKPSISNSKYWSHNGTKPDFELLEVANQMYAEHAASLPVIHLSEQLQSLVTEGMGVVDGKDFVIKSIRQGGDLHDIAFPLAHHPAERRGKEETESVVIIHKGEKWYWCKCESCGWENSSEYAEGGSPIADTGDYTDPMCPVCGSTKLDGESKFMQDESYEKQVVTIPFSDFIHPYKKEIERLQRIESEKYWSKVEEAGGFPASMPEGGEARAYPPNFKMSEIITHIETIFKENDQFVSRGETLYGILTQIVFDVQDYERLKKTASASSREVDMNKLVQENQDLKRQLDLYETSRFDQEEPDPRGDRDAHRW